jgi:hypothetical protein
MTGFYDIVYAILDIITAFFEGKYRAEAMFHPGTATAEIHRVFDDDQLDVLEFTNDDNVVTIRQKQHLDLDTWLAIDAKVGELGGRWVSAGEDSRWELSTAM